MKYLFILTFLFAISAQAELFHCQKSPKEKVLIALERSDGVYYKFKNGKYQPQPGSVHIRRPNGKMAVYVVYQPPKPKVDWAKKEKCYDLGGANESFVIRASETVIGKSTVFYTPQLQTNPKVKNCPNPKVNLAPPKPIFCKMI